ncbi:MAG TPA: LacI family DNA-binding transcriptional regulator [Bryobacteraceae bacterium]|nr:LacI family DNA-binding transcriptional regulator [Bryobacteraceae bacterium]
MASGTQQSDTSQSSKTPTVTMRDVARESGFSPTTVSITLNDAPLARYLPAETKARIKQAARKLGYRPNPFARSLVSKRSQLIGVMVFDITDPWCTPILRGIEKTLYESSYVTIFTDSHNDPTRFERYLEMLLDRRVEALVIVANWLFLDINVLADLRKRDIPTVLIGPELGISSISSVVLDNEAGAYKAIQHLYELGHRDIAFIRGPELLSDTASRWTGIRAFADSVGLAIDPDLVLDLAESADPMSSFDGGIALVEELLRRGKRFTALMAFDDMTALGAMRALAHAGISVPGQCSVIGFDDIGPASIATPGLTTIRQPTEQMGSFAAARVIEEVHAAHKSPGPKPVHHHKVNPELIVRESTAPPTPV